MDVTELCAKSHAAFEAYASMRAGELPEDKWSALQVRLVRWEVANYGLSDHPLAMIALGACEEWCKEFREAQIDHDAATKGAQQDAIGDLGVFLIQAATCLRLDFGTIALHAVANAADVRHVPRGVVDIGIGGLAEVARKTVQRFRGGWSPEKARERGSESIRTALSGLMAMYGAPCVLDLVEYVAEQVMQRRNDKRVVHELGL